MASMVSVIGGSALASVAILFSIPSPLLAQRAQTFSLPPAQAVFSVPGEEFSGITSVRELSDARLLVADQNENRLALIDWRSLTSTPIARRGDGPGEYRGIGWLYPLGGDSTLLTDRHSRRWYILSGLEMVQTVPAADPLASLLGPSLNGSDEAGQVLGVRGHAFSSPMPSGRVNADTLVILLGRRDTNTIDTIARVPGRGRFGICMPGRGEGRGAQIPCNPIASEDLALLFSDGWIAIAHQGPYRVDWRSPDGNWTAGPPLPFEPVDLNDREKCAALEVLNGGPLPGGCDPGVYSQWLVTAPPFFPDALKGMAAPNSPTLFATPTGELLIRRAPTIMSPGSEYDVVDRHGELVGTLSLPANEAIVGFGETAVYVVETDEVDLQLLRRHQWPRSG